MHITLNGEQYQIDASLTVTELLARLEIDGRRVAVEHNLVVVKRGAFDETVVRNGDQVEIVNFVGGGATASGLSTLNKDQIVERGARLARRDDREYGEYLSEEQRSQAGCPAREVVLDQRGQATSADAGLADGPSMKNELPRIDSHRGLPRFEKRCRA